VNIVGVVIIIILILRIRKNLLMSSCREDNDSFGRFRFEKNIGNKPIKERNEILRYS